MSIPRQKHFDVIVIGAGAGLSTAAGFTYKSYHLIFISCKRDSLKYIFITIRESNIFKLDLMLIIFKWFFFTIKI